MPIRLADRDAVAIPIDTGAIQRSPADILKLDIPYIRQAPAQGAQHYKELCWAACCAMVSQAIARCYPGVYPNLPMTICDVASRVLGKSCCPNPDALGCDVPADVPAVYGSCALPCTSWNSYFEWEAIEREIVAGQRPVEIYFEWTKGGAHVALISGLKRSTQELYLLDPLYGTGWTSYDDVRRAYGWGTWTQTYYGIGYSLG